MFYTLDENKNVIPCDITEWQKYYNPLEEQKDKRVGHDKFNDMFISTVFLGLDHNYFGGVPIVFETMVFDKDGNDIYQERYHTWEEAVNGHKTAMEWVKNGCKNE